MTPSSTGVQDSWRPCSRSDSRRETVFDEVAGHVQDLNLVGPAADLQDFASRMKRSTWYSFMAIAAVHLDGLETRLRRRASVQLCALASASETRVPCFSAWSCLNTIFFTFTYATIMRASFSWTS